MSSARPSSSASTRVAAARPWRTLGLRLAIWYAATTLASYVALAAILPVTVGAWTDHRSQRSTETLLERYRRSFETGGTEALRAMFDCRTGPQSSLALRLSDERNVELFSASSDFVSGQLAGVLRGDGESPLSAKTAPAGWHIAAVSVSEGRRLEILMHDDMADVRWSGARALSIVVLAAGLSSAILGAFFITRRALRPLGELASATQRIVDSGDLALRVHDRGTRDELDKLAALFNRMLARNESLVRAMKESLDNVAHDLRTPLTRLRAGAELALRDTRTEPERARQALADAVEESDRVLAMLSTLMDISEAEAGAMVLTRGVHDLADIAREAIDLYDLVSTERGIRVVTSLSVGVLVDVDPQRIRQACANLLDNAIKYTAPGGRVEVAVASEGEMGTLTIRDTGMGIAPEDLPRVWDRLYRGDRSRSERGLGLGLSLVKAVIRAHGGEVRLESTEGAGTTVQIRLRRAPLTSRETRRGEG